MNIKSFIVGLASVGIAVGASAQGLVNFANGSTSLVQVDLGSSGSSNVVNAPSSVYGTRIQLYYSLTAPTTFSSAANNYATDGWTAVGNLGSAIASNGRFSVGQTTIPGAVGGPTVYLEAIAWTGTANTAATAVTSLSSALSGGSYVGAYEWSQLSGDPAATPPGTPISTASSMNALGALVLRPVPEPSTIALAGLGAASLLLFRRK